MKIQNEIRKLANKEIAKKSARFSKTGKGEYGYGDIFLGVRTPVVRKMAKDNIGLNLTDVKKLIKSKYHEERLLGLVILTNKYGKTKSEDEKERLYQIYIKHFKYINCWDLVDVTCPHIVGKHLMDKDRSILYTWAKSNHLWTKRIAMITNWWLVRKGDLNEVYKISEILLNDEHDLIHKAVGWMLREAAKKNMVKTEKFLKKHYKDMPRTMLRYAIEKFPEVKRQRYLKGLV
ncbi:DNA alkylation repair protein [Halobacteriovorax marinus]|uniref:DNA alkylation repair protein n=1 Tax=Halobacteriovorax marinus TaxID=97084 RepID=A0A1Y5F830_9BACT|nr:DNA alkylation repair protein [Halobacteriovorax marinus]